MLIITITNNNNNNNIDDNNDNNNYYYCYYYYQYCFNYMYMTNLYIYISICLVSLFFYIIQPASFDVFQVPSENTVRLQPGFNVEDQVADVRRSSAFSLGHFDCCALHRFLRLVETRLVRLAVMVGDWRIPSPLLNTTQETMVDIGGLKILEKFGKVLKTTV